MNKLLAFSASTFLAAVSSDPLSARPTTMFPVTWHGSKVFCADLNKMGKTPPDVVGYWIVGMWTGLNVAGASPEVGNSTTAAGLVAEVQLWCIDHQSESLTEAVLDTYEQMAKQKK